MMPATSRGSSAVFSAWLLCQTQFSHFTSSEKFNYKRDDIVVLTDDQRDPRSIPTKANIVSLSSKNASFFLTITPIVEGHAMVSDGCETK